MNTEKENEDRKDKIVNALKDTYGFKEDKGWLRRGQCPECGKKELYCKLDTPWLVKCPRENKCGSGGAWQATVKEIFPHFFENFNKRFKPTQENPNATADAYLSEGRGLNLKKISDLYTQGKYYKKGASKSTATVRFMIDEDHGIYMERFVETITITNEDGDTEERKQHFNGKYKGLVWAPPTQEIKAGDTVFLVEACIDALSLLLHGYKVVATLASTNYPDKFLSRAPHGVKWVWALDNDKAGTKYIKEHARRMQKEKFDVCAAFPQPGEKEDWNDLHKKKCITSKHMKEYFHQGEVLLAETAMNKALSIWHHNKGKIADFHLDFNNRWHWFSVNPIALSDAEKNVNQDLPEDEQALEAAEKAATLIQLARCKLTFLYYQILADCDDGVFYTRVEFPDNLPPRKGTFTNAQITNKGQFKERLSSVSAGAIFKGSAHQLDTFVDKNTFGISTVESIDFIGYSKSHRSYVFNDIAISNGQLYRVNDDDYFDIDEVKIKSVDHSITLDITHNKKNYSEEWVEWIWQCYGAKGLIVLTYWFGSLFAEQIRDSQSSYPFLEFVGQAGAGKSTLLEFLWRLFGRNAFEGEDPNKSSASARARYLGQLANMPSVFIEGDREDDGGNKMGLRNVNWDEFKPLFNGRSTHSRGVKTHGNQTYSPLFKSTLVISQNNKINASEAILSRIVHVFLTRENHSDTTKELSRKLKKMTTEDVSYFLVKSVLAEKSILNIVNSKTSFYEDQILQSDKVRMDRIALNHGQLLALFDALSTVVEISDEMRAAVINEVLNMAEERQDSVGDDHPMVAEFWEKLEFLNEKEKGRYAKGYLNHSIDNNLIAINLNEYEECASFFDQRIPLLKDLRKTLQLSRVRKFVGYKSVKSKHTQKAKRCFVFESIDRDCLI